MFQEEPDSLHFFDFPSRLKCRLFQAIPETSFITLATDAGKRRSHSFLRQSG